MRKGKSYGLHALETLLVPARGAEAQKLLLTSRYKQRLMEVFKALITKRRETHVRQSDITHSGAADWGPPPRPSQPTIHPRLRLAPLKAEYARLPMLRLARDGGWETAERLRPSTYVVAVGEFAELRRRGTLTREELRALCDRHKTREAILAALGAP